MHYPLTQLNAVLRKTVSVTSTEQDDKGMYVFRDENGEIFMWSPRPLSYEHHKVESLDEADQITFLCPLCFERNKGSEGTHSVWVSFAGRNVPPEAGSHDSNGNPSRWTIAGGSGLGDLVLTPSILIDAGMPADKGCHWHGFIGSSGIPAGHAG